MPFRSKLAVTIGTLLSVGLVGISALLNFRMGFRTGDTVVDAWVYGSGAAIADGLKALLPFFVWDAWSKRRFIGAGAGALLFVLFTAYSFTAGLGYVALLRDAKRGVSAGQMEVRANLRAEISRLEEQATLLGVHRSAAEVSAEIEQVGKQPSHGGTVLEYSKNCTDIRRSVRKACERLAELKTELGRAQDVERVTGELSAKREALVALGSAGAQGSSDPQGDALVHMLAQLSIEVERKDVEAGLLVLVGMLFELGSGLGLYVVTSPLRSGKVIVSAKSGREVRQTMEELEVVAGARRIGEVDEFALEKLVQQDGASAAGTRIYQAYVAWCRGRGEAPLVELEFMFRFEDLARSIGMQMRQRGGNIIYDGVVIAA